jgi:hypothetical protein
MYVWKRRDRHGKVTGTKRTQTAESVNRTDILLGTVAGAAIVLSGAVYALFFALYRIRRAPWLDAAAWIAYAVLVVSTVLLAHALALAGMWLGIVAVMLIGYLLAPRAIWRLSTATHAHEPDASREARRSRS